MRFWKNMRLRNMFAVVGISLVFLSNALLATFFFRYISERIRRTAYAEASGTALQMGVNIDDKLRALLKRILAMRSHDQFGYNSNFGKFLFHEESHYYAVAQTEMAGILAELRSSEPFVHSVYIYTEKGDFHDFLRIKRPGFSFTDTALYREIEAAGDVPIIWAHRRRDEVYIDDAEIVPLVYPFHVEGYLPVCYFVVNLDAAVIESYLTDTYLSEGGSVLVLGPEGEEILSRWQDMRPVPVAPYMTENRAASPGTDTADITVIRDAWDRYVLAWKPTVIAPWRIAVLKSEKLIDRSLAEAGGVVLLLTLASSVLSFVMAILSSRGITRPLSLLERTIRKVTNRDFETRFEYESANEVGQLGKSFNFMLDEIHRLIGRLNETIEELQVEKERVRSEQLLKRKAELKALQAQINPHFLYNTLNSIIWLADKSGSRDIALMAESLGRFFQISLSDGRELITIGEEAEHVGRYLAIQRMRYGAKLDYSIHIDESVLNVPIVKLTLQPFVENCIYHGLREKDGGGRIEISGGPGAESGTIELEVRDNGLGIDGERLAAIRRRLAEPIAVSLAEDGTAPEGARDNTAADGEGYGIYNVSERIKLHFGDAYGIDFTSVLGAGTTVTIRIPAASTDGGAAGRTKDGSL